MDFNTIKRKIYRNTKTNATSYPIVDLTDDANAALDRVASLIVRADNRWQFDDNNQTDLPIATTALVAGQQDYSLATAHLDIDKVAVKDTNGIWHFLDPIDQRDLKDADLNAATGLPKKYDVLASTVLLYPTPNYSQDASIQLHFKRGPSYFSTSDTTKSPGFNSLYHELIPLWVSYDSCSANGMSNATNLFAKIGRLETALVNDYAFRGPETNVMRPKVESSR